MSSLSSYEVLPEKKNVERNVFLESLSPQAEERGKILHGEIFVELLTRRGVENFHIFLWALKDLAWMRCWPMSVVYLAVTLACSWMVFSLFLDLQSMYNNLTSGTSGPKRVEVFNELAVCVCEALWLFGNAVWCCYEVYDLRLTADYGEIYDIGWYYSTITLFVAGCLSALYIIGVTLVECCCIGDAYTVRYQETILKRAAHKVVKGLSVTNEFEMEVEEVREEVKVRNDWQAQGNHLPRQVAFFVFLGKGKRDLFSGEINSRVRIHCVDGIYKFRQFEFLIICWWCWKDVSWCLEQTPCGRPIWGIAATLCLLLSYNCVRVVATEGCGVIEIYNALTCLTWIVANIIWGYGEMFDSDLIEDGGEYANMGAEERFSHIIRPFSTPLSEWPHGAWWYRHLASCVMLVVASSAVLFYCGLIAVGLYQDRKTKELARTEIDLSEVPAFQ